MHTLSTISKIKTRFHAHTAAKHRLNLLEYTVWKLKLEALLAQITRIHPRKQASYGLACASPTLALTLQVQRSSKNDQKALNLGFLLTYIPRAKYKRCFPLRSFYFIHQCYKLEALGPIPRLFLKKSKLQNRRKPLIQKVKFCVLGFARSPLLFFFFFSSSFVVFCCFFYLCCNIQL